MRSKHIFCVDLYFHNIGNIDNVDYGDKRIGGLDIQVGGTDKDGHYLG